MVEFLSFEEIYERVYPTKLLLTEDTSDADYQLLVKHFETVGSIVEDIAGDIRSSFSGRTQTQQLQKLNDHLSDTADALWAGENFLLSMVAVDLAAIVVRRGGNVARAENIFDRFEERAQIEQLNLEEKFQETIRKNPPHADGAMRPEVKAACEVWLDHFVAATATIATAAARIPLETEAGDDFRDRAFRQLVWLARNNVGAYEDVVLKHMRSCADGREFPGCMTLLERSYMQVTADAAMHLPEMLEPLITERESGNVEEHEVRPRQAGQGIASDLLEELVAESEQEEMVAVELLDLECDSKKAWMVAVELLGLAAGIIVYFQDMPFLERRAFSAFTEHWQFLDSIDSVDAAQELDILAKECSGSSGVEEVKEGLSVLSELIEGLQRRVVDNNQDMQPVVAPAPGDAHDSLADSIWKAFTKATVSSSACRH